MADALAFSLHKTRPGFALAAESELPPGLTTLVGPSGAGKTTLLRCLAGLEAPDAGHIALGPSVWLAGRQSLPARSRRVGFVFEGGALFPHLSVLENVAFGARGNGAEALACLEAFEALALAGRSPRGLSAGERQRVALARAIAMAPAALLLDEPFSGLDAPLRDRLIGVLAAIVAERQLPALLVTHDLGEAALGDRLAVMAAGRWLAAGPPDDVLFRPPSPEVARLVGITNRFEGDIDAAGTLHWGPHRLPVGAPAGTRRGWCVRAEAVGWAPEAEAGPGCVSGVIAALVPCPGGYRFQVAIDGTADRLEVVWSAPLAARAGLAAGRAIGLVLPPGALHVFS